MELEINEIKIVFENGAPKLYQSRSEQHQNHNGTKAPNLKYPFALRFVRHINSDDGYYRAETVVNEENLLFYDDFGIRNTHFTRCDFKTAPSSLPEIVTRITYADEKVRERLLSNPILGESNQKKETCPDSSYQLPPEINEQKYPGLKKACKGYFFCNEGTFSYKENVGKDNLTITDQICNFRIDGLFYAVHFYINNKSRIEICLKISNDKVPCFEVTINSTQLNNVILKIKELCPQMHLNPDNNKAARKLSALISEMLSTALCGQIVHTAGWHCLYNGSLSAVPNASDISWRYLDDCSWPNSLIRPMTGKTMRYFPDMSAEESFFHTMRLLRLSDDMSKTLPLLLFAHIGVMYTLFECAGVPPRFMLFLCGVTGSLKTSVAKVFFQILSNGNDDLTSTMNDTLAAHEIAMGRTKDEVLLLDDFRPSSLKGEYTKMKKNLESVIRYFGDGIGKNRAESNMALRETNTPHAVCAITGELVEGISSSLKKVAYY